MAMRPLIAVIVSTAAFAAGAQQLYRWTDEKGRVNITDTPPPASARKIEKPKPPPDGIASQPPYELERAMKSYPVTLYTSPNCKEPCQDARTLLNRRAVPFKEVQVTDEPSHEELKKVSGASDVPTLVVGRSVHRGYQAGAYDALLDSARYPRAGLLPPRSQAAPPPPKRDVEGEEEEEPKAEPKARGPYAPRPERN